MNTDERRIGAMEVRPFQFTGRIRSFKYAIVGLSRMIRCQHNAWIHAAEASAYLFSSAFENKRRYNFFLLFESVKSVSICGEHMRVDFVIGGTQKGGTSALDSFLRQHPEVCMPTTRKELHFFDREEENRDYKKYHANFKPQPQHRGIGAGNPIFTDLGTRPHAAR